MININELRFFGVIATSPSLAAAARRLEVSRPAVTQRLRQLELKLKVRIVNRSTRRLRLTDEGELLAARGSEILAELETLAETMNARSGVVTGNLRVVAPFGFGRRFIAPVIAAFSDKYPAVDVSLTLSENPAGIRDDRWDVLIHLGELRDSSLVAQRLAPNDRIICASPAYLVRHSPPTTPQDLEAHDAVVLRENDEDGRSWKFQANDGGVTAVRINPRMSSNDGDVVRRWALAGRGIMVRSEWDVAEELQTGKLVRLLAGYRLPSADIVALTTARMGRAARITTFLSELRASLDPVPWRTPCVDRPTPYRHRDVANERLGVRGRNR